MKYSIFFILIFILAFLGCSKEDVIISNLGTIQFKIKWQIDISEGGGKLTSAYHDDCKSAGVSSIYVQLLEYDNSVLFEKLFPCSSFLEVIENIPNGQNRKLMIEGKDASGKTIYKGEKNNIAVLSGKELNIGEIIPENLKITMKEVFCVATSNELQDALDKASKNTKDNEILLNIGKYEGNFSYNSDIEDKILSIKGGYIDNCSKRGINPSKTTLISKNKKDVFSVTINKGKLYIHIDNLAFQNKISYESKGSSLNFNGDLKATISNTTINDKYCSINYDK
ncbi:MAG: hypothetical protein HQK76_12955 [Desulfobacterales bacterium]|nr:hypothetical protein [Desulfobacterales bacterium]